MTINNFIDNNILELTRLICLICPNCPELDHEEIESWILNDEGLYNWAISEGVDI